MCYLSRKGAQDSLSFWLLALSQLLLKLLVEEARKSRFAGPQPQFLSKNSASPGRREPRAAAGRGPPSPCPPAAPFGYCLGHPTPILCLVGYLVPCVLHAASRPSCGHLHRCSGCPGPPLSAHGSSASHNRLFFFTEVPHSAKSTSESPSLSSTDGEWNFPDRVLEQPSQWVFSLQSHPPFNSLQKKNPRRRQISWRLSLG